MTDISQNVVKHSRAMTFTKRVKALILLFVLEYIAFGALLYFAFKTMPPTNLIIMDISREKEQILKMLGY